ncbi:hypothetical protein AB205_0063740, partial [Aquarana catesbeiana]
TGDLIDVSVGEEPPSKPPAKVLATGQRVQDLCPTPVAVSEAQGEKVPVTFQQQIQGEKGEEVCVVPPQQLARVEEAAFLPQPRSVHLGDSTTDMSFQQPDEGMEQEAAGSPPQWQLHSLGVEESSLLPQGLARAEVLATGQSSTNLCPAPATTVEIQGAGAVGPSLRRQADVVELLLPAESLATGQNVAGLCLAPTISSQLQGIGTVGPSVQQQAKPWNGKHHPAEALTARQRLNDLCPTPTVINYSLQPRKEIMREDYVSSLCLTNACPDQVEVWDLVSQPLMGEKCDRLTKDRGYWRGLNVPTDYGPWILREQYAAR